MQRLARAVPPRQYRALWPPYSYRTLQSRLSHFVAASVRCRNERPGALPRQEWMSTHRAPNVGKRPQPRVVQVRSANMTPRRTRPQEMRKETPRMQNQW